MSRTPVLHLQDTHQELDRTFLAAAFLGQGEAVTIHVTEYDGSTTVYQFREERGRTTRTVYVASKTHGCGCP